MTPAKIFLKVMIQKCRKNITIVPDLIDRLKLKPIESVLAGTRGTKGKVILKKDYSAGTFPRCSNLMALMVAFLLSVFATGCGTLTNDRGWGQDISYPVNLKMISRAAHNAFFDLQTLIPAAGALIFAVDDFDEEVSDWATDNNPIFWIR